jgi:hypothetical protein
MSKKIKIRIREEQEIFFPRAFLVKILTFFYADADPGIFFGPGSGIRDGNSSDPGFGIKTFRTRNADIQSNGRGQL